MSEEEKEAIDYLENQDNSVNWNYPTLQAILSALNYIDKLQKENEELKEKIKHQYELLEKFEEHIDKETIMKIYDEDEENE